MLNTFRGNTLIIKCVIKFNLRKGDFKMKVAVIGCGTIANTAHIPAYIKNGKHVLCEKPIACNYEEGEKFVSLVKQHPECRF